MHPFYGPSRQLLHRDDTVGEGLVSMAAYLLFWAAVVPLAIRGLKRHTALATSGPAEHDPAVAVLRLRLARGDIDVEDYLTRREILHRTVVP